jgi:hypothetical protein
MAILAGCWGRRGWRLRAAALALAGGAAAFAAGPARAQEPSLEYAVKANYLYKLGPFVEWPPGAFAGPASPFNVCVLGADPFGQVLEDAVRGQTVNGRPVAIRRLQVISGVPACHVLYLGRSQAQSPAEALKALRGAPVLTVTDERQGFSGGVVHFVLRQGRVRFMLDVGAARANGLAISSKLLGLAISMRRGAG